MRGGGTRKKTYSDPERSRLTAVNIPSDTSLSILDVDNPKSLINLVPRDFRVRLESVPRRYFEMTEDDLREVVEPDDILDRLRLRFWDEWQVALLSGFDVNMSIKAVYYGVCTEEFFYAKVLQHAESLAWLVTPPTDYVVTMRDVLKKGIERLSDIISLPLIRRTPMKEKGTGYIRDENGDIMYQESVDVGVAREIRQTVSMLSDRVHGAIVQRLDVNERSLRMELTSDTRQLLDSKNGLDINGEPGDRAPELTDDELSDLDSQIAKISVVLDSNEVIDVESGDSQEGQADTLPDEDEARGEEKASG